MNATTVAVDLAKSVFQLAVADASWQVIETHRLTRTQFERWFVNRDVSLVVMEACGSAHHWARWLNGLGIEVRLLPAQYVRAYVKRNKTDAADAAALLEACRASDMRPVRVKSVEQQALQGMHRSSRYLGHISKKGDRYLRMLLTHGARSVLRAAVAAQGKGQEVQGVRHWALQVQARSNHNKATCALANKLARICYATLRDKARFGEPTVRLGKKISRESFAMPA
jgi:transposase